MVKVACSTVSILYTAGHANEAVKAAAVKDRMLLCGLLNESVGGNSFFAKKWRLEKYPRTGFSQKWQVSSNNLFILTAGYWFKQSLIPVLYYLNDTSASCKQTARFANPCNNVLHSVALRLFYNCCQNDTRKQWLFNSYLTITLLLWRSRWYHA